MTPPPRGARCRPDPAAARGVNWLNVAPASFGDPVNDVAGSAKVGDAFALPVLRDAATYQIADHLSVDEGDHLLKMGDEFHVRRIFSAEGGAAAAADGADRILAPNAVV